MVGRFLIVTGHFPEYGLERCTQLHGILCALSFKRRPNPMLRAIPFYLFPRRYKRKLTLRLREKTGAVIAGFSLKLLHFQSGCLFFITNRDYTEVLFHFLLRNLTKSLH